ncbi:MAG: hypothetical protein EOO92_15345 [Pedobacter sp.]|nr:MAG: hypothetical protein EOO92_15345 [Pedobacter sp.]
MKAKYVVLISLIALLIISIYVRETGLFEVNYYKSNNQLSHTDEWTSINPSDDDKIKRKPVNKDDLSMVILFGKDTIYKKLNKLVPIVVIMDTLEAGPMWYPLYKSTKYTASGSTSLFETGFDDPSHHGIDRVLKGNFNYKGELTIVGFCSNRKAKEILYASVIADITEKVKEKFATLPEDFFTGHTKNSVAANY